MNLLKGKLTYIMAAVAILWAAAGYLFFGLDSVTTMEVLWGGLTVFGIRRAI